MPIEHLEPGGVAHLKPSVAPAPTVKWEMLTAPDGTKWAQNLEGQCVISAPLVADGGTVVMNESGPWLPLTNPGFETGGAGVAYVSGATITLDDTLGPDGARTLRVTPTMPWDGPTFTTAVTAGRSYEFTAAVKASEAPAGYTLRLGIVWRDSSGAEVGNLASTTQTPTTSWGELTATGAAPAGAASATLQVTHTELVSPRPYYLGTIRGRDTSQTLNYATTVVSIAPARVVKFTEAGPAAHALRVPAMVGMDTSQSSTIAGAWLGGAPWYAHREGPSTSVLDVARDITDQGRYRFVVGEATAPGGSVQRAELSGVALPLARSTTWWWSLWFRIAGPPPASGWMNLVQVHQTPDGGEHEGPQPLGIYWQGSGRLIATRRYDPSAATTDTSYLEVETDLTPSLAVGVWHRLVLRVRLDKGGAGGASGSLGVWFNGAQKVDVAGVPFGYNDTAENYPKFGIYRGSGAGVNVAEFAQVEIGTADLSSRISSPKPITATS